MDFRIGAGDRRKVRGNRGGVQIKTAVLLFSATSLGTLIKGLNDKLDMTA